MAEKLVEVGGNAAEDEFQNVVARKAGLLEPPAVVEFNDCPRVTNCRISAGEASASGVLMPSRRLTWGTSLAPRFSPTSDWPSVSLARAILTL